MNTLGRRLWRFVPALFLGAILWILGKGLVIERHQGVSTETPFPSFSLADVRTGHQLKNLEDLKGQISIIHVWASWCSVCVKEHEEWLHIKEKWPYPLVGIVYRDDVQKVLTVLKKGDPYNHLLNDISGGLGLDLGIIGTPETFIVDANGVIRFHHLGPVTQEVFETTFLPVLEKLEKHHA